MTPLFLLAALVALGAGHGGAVDHAAHGYRFNGPLEFECARNGTFSRAFAPQCLNAQWPLAFKYGIDTMMMVRGSCPCVPRNTMQSPLRIFLPPSSSSVRAVSDAV